MRRAARYTGVFPVRTLPSGRVSMFLLRWLSACETLRATVGYDGLGGAMRSPGSEACTSTTSD